MRILFHHTHGYDWEKVEPSQVQEGDKTATNAAGDLTRRIKIESPSTDVSLPGGALERIHADREAAGLPKKSDVSILVQHLGDAVVPAHFDTDDLVAVQVEEDPEMEAALAAVFGVPAGAPTNDATPVVTQAPAQEETSA
jgi:hypothetical protein